MKEQCSEILQDEAGPTCHRNESSLTRVLRRVATTTVKVLSHTRSKKEVTEYDSHTSQIRVATTVEVLVLSHTRTKKEVRTLRSLFGRRTAALSQNQSKTRANPNSCKHLRHMTRITTTKITDTPSYGGQLSQGN